eukprot:3026745-Alexandrium_andersonii.AAC.1
MSERGHAEAGKPAQSLRRHVKRGPRARPTRARARAMTARGHARARDCAQPTRTRECLMHCAGTHARELAPA